MDDKTLFYYEVTSRQSLQSVFEQRSIGAEALRKLFEQLLVTSTLLIEADNMYGVCVLGGSYADVQLNLGTIDGGTYDKVTENGGNVRGGFFRDISGLSADT